MKAAVFRELGRPLEIEDVEIGQPGPHEVLLRRSITRKNRPSSVLPWSWTGTTVGSCRAARTLASRTKRACRDESGVNPACMILTATGRSRLWSRAAYTAPIAPRPMHSESR